jgi:RNA polymerase sigma-70 factor (ECF subfamily)
MRITRSVLIDYVRRVRPTTPLLDDLQAASDSEDEEPSRLGAYMLLLVKQLGSTEQEAVQLVDIEGLSGPTAAQQLGISLPALKARLHRARQRLRSAISQCCDLIVDGRGQPHDCEPKQATSCSSC